MHASIAHALQLSGFKEFSKLFEDNDVTGDILLLLVIPRSFQSLLLSSTVSSLIATPHHTSKRSVFSSLSFSSSSLEDDLTCRLLSGQGLLLSYCRARNAVSSASLRYFFLTLLLLSHQDDKLLLSMGVRRLGQRTRIMNEIQRLKETRWPSFCCCRC